MRLLSALFHSATAAVCLGKTFRDSKLTAWIRLWHTGRSTPLCAHETACVRARTQYVSPTIVPSKSHRYDFPQVEFKKKTPFLATLRDFRLSGLRRVFAGFCKFQVVVDASPRCHQYSGPSTEINSVILAVKRCKSSKRRPKASTDDRPSTRNLL